MRTVYSVFAVVSLLTLGAASAGLSADLNVTGNLCAGSSGCTGIPPDDIVVNDTFPVLRLDDTSTNATDYDLQTSGLNFIIQSLPTGASSSIPFTIESGTRNNALYLDSTGDIGLGTSVPRQELHLAFTSPSIRFEDTDNGQIWDLNGNNNGFRVFSITQGTTPLWIDPVSPPRVGINTTNPQDTLDVVGGLTVSGTVSLGSSREVKHDLGLADNEDVLARIRELPIFTWRYNQDESNAKHIGPMAEDFRAAFGLGRDDKHIAPSDQAGVALAAVQELAAHIAALEAENAELRLELRELEDRTRSVPGESGVGNVVVNQSPTSPVITPLRAPGHPAAAEERDRTG